MSGAARDRGSYRRVINANDHFKAQWSNCWAWSMVAATGLHVVTFILWPAWNVSTQFVDEGAGRQSFEWITLSLPVAGAPGNLGEDAGPEVEAAPVGGEGTQLSPWEAAGLSDAMRQLLRGPQPVATLAEPAPQESPDDRTASGPTPIGGDASSAVLEELAAADSLALELLAALRPELALLDPSSWILVRNPVEVGDFMRRSAELPTMPGERRVASVALWINESGSVEWAEINQSSGSADLDELALELFNDVVAFRPARDQGVRVPISAIFWVNFPW